MSQVQWLFLLLLVQSAAVWCLAIALDAQRDRLAAAEARLSREAMVDRRMRDMALRASPDWSPEDPKSWDDDRLKTQVLR